MSYAYPAPRTGTAQDLFRILTRAYELELERSGRILPEKNEWARRWVEPPFRLFGIIVAKTMEVVPAEWTIPIHDHLFRFLAKGQCYPYHPEHPVLVRAEAMAARLEQETGRAPALLALISHPPVVGDWAHLNFELVRHATLALRQIRRRACRPRLVAAIDPFALDSNSIIEEGLYAGYMGTFHVGIDRLSLGRGHWGPDLTPQASWTQMPHRLFSLLAKGGEIGMVLSGGVPRTARTLYGVREWVRQVRQLSPLRLDPAQVDSQMQGDDSFRHFKDVISQEIILSRGTWIFFDAWLMAVCAGLIPGQTSGQAAQTALAALRIDEKLRPKLLAGLARDLERETPSRRRLFRILSGRVARRRPIIMIPIVHRTNPLGIEIREAWSFQWKERGVISVRRAHGSQTPIEMSPDSFADQFVEENFN